MKSERGGKGEEEEEKIVVGREEEGRVNRDIAVSNTPYWRKCDAKWATMLTSVVVAASGDGGRAYWEGT